MSLNQGEAIILYFFLPNMKFKKLFSNGKNVIFSMDKKERKRKILKLHKVRFSET